MIKTIARLALPCALLLLCGCARNSEARVTVNNTGALAITVSLDYQSTTIPAGGSDTLALNWPGGGALDVELAFFPVGQPQRLQYVLLELQPGQDLSLNLGFAG